MAEQTLSPVRIVGPVTIVPAKPEEVSAILDLVHTVNLPRDGVEEALEHFWVARQDGQVVGTVGLEVYGDLRTVTLVGRHPGVAGPCSGTGVDDTALSYLMSRQFRVVYLLTTTAEQFFRRRDFLVVARTTVPGSVQQSVEFQSACPDTATCMARNVYLPCGGADLQHY